MIGEEYPGPPKNSEPPISGYYIIPVEYTVTEEIVGVMLGCSNLKLFRDSSERSIVRRKRQASIVRALRRKKQRCGIV